VLQSLLTLALMLLRAGGPALANEPDRALELVQDTADRMLVELRENRTELERDPGRIYDLVSEIVLPHFDFEAIARWVMGRYWRQATPEQRQRFTEEFRTLLVRTYARALLEYSGETLSYAPLQAAPDADDVTVRSEVLRPSGPVIPINYRLHHRDDAWKVYDVNVDGVSLVTNYRSSIGSQIGREGLDAVIDQLSERNRSGSVDG
jgi:phospholipid transport system substrate-binding protein